MASLAKKSIKLDETAFKALYNKFWKKLFIFASSILMDENQAKDVVQEIWVDFWKRRNDVSIDNIEAYLYQAVRYQTYKIFKQKKIIKVQIEVINNLSIDPQVELEHNYEHTKLLLKKQIDKLPNRCRQIFILSKYNGLTNDQIAEQEGISKRTIENQLSIAKGILEPFAKGRNR